MRATRVSPRVALVTYSTKPRGGAVHTVHLAEALYAAGQPVHVYALGDPSEGFFRPVMVPHTIVEAPQPAPTLTERVFAAVDALADGLSSAVVDRFDLVHTQDCIAARAATRVRDATGAFPVLRTVHHMDDFTTAALVDCQRQSIVEPDRILVVSDFWRQMLARGYDIEATVVTNGCAVERFRVPPEANLLTLRARVGAEERFLLLTVGGIEPRKGSVELVEALARLRPMPILAVVGGHSFQDHHAYRDRVLARASELGLVLGRDIVMLGTVPDAELPGWYHAADAFVFPSVKEGWGMAVLEAMAAGLPVVATDIPVFREFLTDDHSALLARPGDATSLTHALQHLCDDARLRARLAKIGPIIAARYTWEACAKQHIQIYRELMEHSPQRGCA